MAKGKRVRSRQSITVRPTTQQLLDEMRGHSTLSDTELFRAGIDVLHFMWSVLRGGGEVLTQFPGDQTPSRVEIFVPGLIRRGYEEVSDDDGL